MTSALYTAYWNNIEARKDWKKIKAQHPELAKQFDPGDGASYRKIDKAIARVRAEAEKQTRVAP